MIDEVDKELVTFIALGRIGEFPVIFSTRVNIALDFDILVDKQELCIEPIKEINRVQDMKGYNQRPRKRLSVEPCVWFWHQFLPEKKMMMIP